MYPRIVSFGMTYSGISSSTMHQMEHHMGCKDTVHLLISDESSAPQMVERFVKKYGEQRLRDAGLRVTFYEAQEPGHLYGAVKQHIELHPDKEINVYLDTPSLLGIRPATDDARVVLNDRVQSVAFEHLLEQNPNVVIRIATLRVPAYKMIDFARATGTLSK